MVSRRRNRSVVRWPVSAKLLILSALVTILGFSAICGRVMWDMRRGEEALARQTSANLAATIEADISRTIELYDLSLRAVVSGMMLPEISTVSKDIRDLILFDRAATASHFGAIQVFDAHGDLVVDASSQNPPPENRADDDFFKVHRNDGEAGLYVSKPMLHRGAYSVVLSRRITAADGSFAGVVVGSIRFTYFHALFERLRLDRDDTIAVVRKDGLLLMRTPFDLDFIGKQLAGGQLLRGILRDPFGSTWGIGPLDDVERLYVWRNGGQQISVVVGKPAANIYSLWRQQAIRIGSVMLALICFVVAVTLFCAREIIRRARAEDQLELLATTDSLTGVRNRRKFDDMIDVEWRRAMRQGTPLAMLLIDADHFKLFNDTYGHQSGDQALIAIAQCISSSVGRAADCAARYGGEEFAVLLPGSSADAAYKVAETIRRKVEEMPADPAPLTISIGIASITPLVTMEASGLVEAADKALYAAKAAGRNQSMIAKSPHLLIAAYAA